MRTHQWLAHSHARTYFADDSTLCQATCQCRSHCEEGRRTKPTKSSREEGSFQVTLKPTFPDGGE